jgi:Na+-driven multidrug efflux pump
LSTIVAGFVVTVIVVGLLSAPMRPVLPWWSIVAANASATLLAGAYLLRKRSGLWGHLFNRTPPRSLAAKSHPHAR